MDTAEIQRCQGTMSALDNTGIQSRREGVRERGKSKRKDGHLSQNNVEVDHDQTEKHWTTT